MTATGILLATSVPTASVYANPRHLLDARDAARRIVTVLPEMNEAKLFRRLNSEGTFVWIRRNITPNQQFAINALGLPGIYFRRTERRVYPHGSLTSHVVGTTDIDAKGLTGIERNFDRRLQDSEQALALSLDVRVQSVVRRALNTAIEKFSAVGGAGIVVDVTNGEVLALVSLPDFEPHFGGDVTAEARFNRVTKGVYEMGSTFKLFTTAMALDSKTIGLNGGFDATRPLRVARFVINDYHAKKRWLSVPEILVHSSNIGAAKMGVAVGIKTQQAYLRALGLTRKAKLELPEIGVPVDPVAVAQNQHHDHFLRSRHRRLALADGERDRRAGQWRDSARCHLGAQRAGRGAGRRPGHQDRHIDQDAQAHASGGPSRHGQKRRGGGVSGGRQDRHRR